MKNALILMYPEKTTLKKLPIPSATLFFNKTLTNCDFFGTYVQFQDFSGSA